MRTLTAFLVGRTARVRWVHLVLGGALLMPFWMLGTVLASALIGGRSPNGPTDVEHTVLPQVLALLVALPIAWVVALLPVARVLLATAARALAGSRATEFAHTPADSWAARRRTAHWFVLHLLVGGVMSGLSLAVPPMAVLLCVAPLGVLGHPGLRLVHQALGAQPPPTPPLGLALLLGLLLMNAGAGALLARCAPVLLGPTPAEQLAAAERRSLVLAQRNRLARELHDSVGHALTAVTIQAGAARRVLHRDPGFAEEALLAIEEVTRAAVAELDTVLGLLREDADDGAATDGSTGSRGSTGPRADGATGPTLDALDPLVRQLRLAGVSVTARTGPGVTALPDLLSREAYRIVQEGLTNVLRHAGSVPATLTLEIDQGRLTVELTNPLGAARPSRPGGGRGLRGVAERAAARGGGCESGRTADGLGWRLAVWLPVVEAA